MCLGIPMRVTSVDGWEVRCEARGAERTASLLMFQDEAVREGDYVIVHLGYVTQKVTAEEAKESWKLFDQILDAGS